MSPPSGSPVPYKVVYSERVRTELKPLLSRATAAGLGQPALAAVKEIDRRLHLFPQFGEPLTVLQTDGETVWVGTVSPLVVRYVIDEERRTVLVIVPLQPLPNSGL